MCSIDTGHQIAQTIIANIVGLLHRSRLLSKTFISHVSYIGSLEKNRLLKFPWQMHGAGTFTYYFLPWKPNQTVGKYTLRPMDPSWDILHLPAKPSHLRGIGILRIHSVEVSHVLFNDVGKYWAPHTKKQSGRWWVFLGPTRKICINIFI